MGLGPTYRLREPAGRHVCDVPRGLVDWPPPGKAGIYIASQYDGLSPLLAGPGDSSRLARNGCQENVS